MPHSNTNLARRVVCNAHEYNRMPSVITDSWMRLKHEQGHPITPERLDRLERIKIVELPPRATSPTPPPPPTLASDLAARAPRISARIAARVAQLRGVA